MVCGVGIDLRRLLPVKIGAARDMADPLNRLDLIFSALLKFFLLLPDTVLSHPVTERALSLHLYRQIRHIYFRDCRDNTLNAHKRPLLLVKNLDCRKGMGKFRAKHMQNIRVKVIDNKLKFLLQFHIITLRRSQILHEPVTVAGNIFPQLHHPVKFSERLIHRKSNAKLDAVSFLLHHNPVEQTGKPSLPVAAGKI